MHTHTPGGLLFIFQNPTQMSPLLRSLPAPQGRASSLAFRSHTRLFTAPHGTPTLYFICVYVFTTKPDHPWLILKPAWLSGGGRMLCSKTTGFKSHLIQNFLRRFALCFLDLTGEKNVVKRTEKKLKPPHRYSFRRTGS